MINDGDGYVRGRDDNRVRIIHGRVMDRQPATSLLWRQNDKDIKIILIPLLKLTPLRVLKYQFMKVIIEFELPLLIRVYMDKSKGRTLSHNLLSTSQLSLSTSSRSLLFVQLYDMVALAQPISPTPSPHNGVQLLLWHLLICAL